MIEAFMHFIDAIKDNQLLMTLFGVGGAGMITFWLRNVPLTIYRSFKRQFTTEILVTNQHDIFYDLLRWIEDKYGPQKFRKVKLNNGRWGYEGLITSIGYGYHFIWYNKSPLFITLSQVAANQTEREKEVLTVTKFGRSQNIFKSIIDEAIKVRTDESKVEIYRFNKDSWHYVKSQPKRHLDSIIIEKDKKDKILSTISRFKNEERWYVDNGIPYQLGILLYGPPGTGKTSLIKSLSAYLGYPIYYLSPRYLSQIEAAMSNLPNKSILVIEDIDSSYLSKDRDTGSELSELSEMLESTGPMTLSDVLNALDGFFSAHGRILIATTNYIDKIDKAMLRPGRIDLQVEVGHVNSEMLSQFTERFYNKSSKTKSVKEKVTVAQLQNMVLQGKSYDDVIKHCLEDNK